MNFATYLINLDRATERLAAMEAELSPLKVMETFLQREASHALVLEDDAVLPSDFVLLLQRALKQENHWDLLRLSSSRKGKFLPITELDSQYRLAINTLVLKNIAA